MASLGYDKSLRRYRVRWRATNRKAVHNRIFSGSKVFPEKTEAVNFYAEIEKQERLWRKGQVPGRTIAQVLKDFFRFAQQFTKLTQGHYKMVLKSFVGSLPEDIVWIQQIKASHVRGYLSRILDNGFKNRTCNAHLTAIKSFCRYLHENYDILNIATRVRMFKEDPPNARFLTKEEYHKLLEIASPLQRDRLMFLANTGLRANEFASLKPSCVDEELTTLTIVGKGRKQRTIPLNKIAKELWLKIQPATRTALYLQFRRLAKKAGIPKFGPHALRHYFATQLLLAGVPIVKVSIVLGHASVTTTQACYAHILPEDLMGITDSLCDENTVEQPETVRFPIVLRRNCQPAVTNLSIKRA